MTDDCVFCRIAKGKAPASRVYEDELVVAFLDIHPVTPGHTLVIPIEHSIGLEDLPTEIGWRLFSVASNVAAALRTSELTAEGINLFLADGAAAGQEVFHTHLHVFPRFRGDGFAIRAQRELPERQVLESQARAIRNAYQELGSVDASTQ